MRIGVKLPSSGRLAGQPPLKDAARHAEEAGFDSVWVSDHVVMLREVASPYPFSQDGRMYWDPEEPWYDALISMATAAAVTNRVEVGVAVLVVPMRNPLILAKQLATLDALSGGRVVLGAGAGWLAEEFEALDSPFESRGERFDEWIDILRDCWTGAPQNTDYKHYRIPDGILCYPTPSRQIPVLIGGMSKAAFRRAGHRGDGWLAIQHVEEINVAALRSIMENIGNTAHLAGRPMPERIAMRISGPIDDIARQLGALVKVGVTDVVVDVDWLDRDSLSSTAEMLRKARGDSQA